MIQLLPCNQLPELYIQGLNVSWTSNTTLSIAAGQCRDSANSMDIVIGAPPLNGFMVNAPITINSAMVGYNGIDSGTIQSQNCYAVYLIADSTYKNPPGAILSRLFTGPALPPGYDSYRLRDFVVTDGTAMFRPFYKIGNGAIVSTYFTNTVDLGIVGGVTSYQGVLCDFIIPPNFAYVTFVATFTPATAANQFYIRTDSANATVVNNTTSGSGVVASMTQISEVSVLCNQSAFDWKNTSASDGFTLSIKSIIYSV